MALLGTDDTVKRWEPTLLFGPKVTPKVTPVVTPPPAALSAAPADLALKEKAQKLREQIRDLQQQLLEFPKVPLPDENFYLHETAQKELINWKLHHMYGPWDPPQLYARKTDELRNLATHRINGDRFQAKSALVEFILSKYMMRGSTGYDFYCADDLESLTALDARCPYNKKVVLVHGPNIRLKCNYETRMINDLDPRKEPAGKLFITCKAFFLSDYERYAGLLHFTKMLRLRAQFGWDYVGVIALREMQEYAASKIQTNQVRTMKEAGEDFINFHNQAFHAGMSVIIDSQRDVEVAKNLRELNTYTYYKNIGSMEVPDKARWLMREDGPNINLGVLRSMDKDQFILVTNKNAIYFGTFNMPPWHIKRGDKLLERFNIIVKDKAGKEIDFVKALENQEMLQANAENPMASPNGKKSIITPDQDALILKLVQEGKKTPDIMPIVKKVGYIGSVRTLRERVHDHRAKIEEVAASQQS